MFSDLSPSYQHLFSVISAAADKLGYKAYVVGGFVRDYYLGRLNSEGLADIDIMTIGSGLKLAAQVAKDLGAGPVNEYKQFGTAHFNYDRMSVEFVGARRESYRRESRKPIVEDGTLEDDQQRRDFTINALSWSLNKEDFGLLLDPFGGIQDLHQGILRTPIDPMITFDDDPLRMLRAIRFAGQLNFNIDEPTYAGIKACAERIKIISQERITDELNKMLLCEKPSLPFSMLFKTGLLKIIFPELHNLQGVDEVNGHRHKDNFWHTLEVVDNISQRTNDLWLRWAALLHDIAKPPTKRFDPKEGWTFHGHDALGARWVKSIFRRFGLPMDERMKYVAKLVRLHLRPIALASEIVTDSAIRRLIFDTGNDIDDLMTLCRADITSKNHEKVNRYLKNFDRVAEKIIEVEEKDRLRNWQPPVDGIEIMDTLGLKPGRAVGVIKKAIEEAILNGDIPNEHDAAFAFMMEHKDELLRDFHDNN
jgi:tRNA nucleotidyltransferase (CCA-adding enzyme)